MICYESLFADLARQQCLNGATYLVNASNDAWYKTWSACEQLLDMTVLRAVENRRWLLRAVNHGISAAVDPCGRIVQSIGLEREGYFVQTIRLSDQTTFYAEHGPLLGWLWAIFGLGAALTIRLRPANGAKP
ncbi:MAG: Apolipoprotein N-acyltransferase [Deltaproteobacteria bacterium ADurb.Bin510]|nr:MAG: Apolipoprotein N-acyltransferase [Deltaproteobacteria bacterium ADurb.Bin510]